MAKINQNFAMWSGDSLDLVVTVTDDAGKAIDLTGSTIKWVLFKNVNSATAEVSKTTGDGITVILPASQGKFSVSITPADTQAMVGNYFHEAQVTDGSGDKSTVLTGQATINRSHTN